MTWNFVQPRNLAVVTVDRVIAGGNPVLYVSHDEDDGGWQFLDEAVVADSNARIASLGQLVDSDSTLAELADLPEGFVASRITKGDGWIRVRRS